MKKILHIVLILTFINSGLSCFSFLLVGVLMPQFQTIYNSGQLPIPDQFRIIYDQLFAMPRLLFVLQGLLFALSLAGAILMWNYHHAGWHLYTIANLLLIALPPLFLGSDNLNIGAAMFSLLFIAFYYIALRQITLLDNTQQDYQQQPLTPKPQNNDDDDDDDDD